MTAQPADLTFANDVRGIVPRGGARRDIQPEPLTRDRPLLYKTMLLLNDVVLVGYWPTLTVQAQFALSLQIPNRGRISWMTIDIETRGRGLPRTQREPQKARLDGRNFHRPARTDWDGASRAECADAESTRNTESWSDPGQS
jgi:hypothetical protein